MIIKHCNVGGDEIEWNGKNCEKMMIKGGDEDFTIVLVTENFVATAAKKEQVVRREITAQDLSIYPNPSDGTFTIRLNQDEKAKTSIKI